MNTSIDGGLMFVDDVTVFLASLSVISATLSLPGIFGMATVFGFTGDTKLTTIGLIGYEGIILTISFILAIICTIIYFMASIFLALATISAIPLLFVVSLPT